MPQPVILVTGSTDGIGKQTALELAAGGARVIVHGRSANRVAAATEEIRKAVSGADPDCVVADFASFEQVRRMAAEVGSKHPDLSVVINNAGSVLQERRLSEEGIEMTFAVNHLAPFLLTNLLLPILRQNAPARVVTVSSGLHTSGHLNWDKLASGPNPYNGYQAYNDSKLCNVLFAFELAEREKKHGVMSNALTPGVIATKMLRQGWGASGGGSVEQGAATSVFLAVSDEAGKVTGKYFRSNRQSEPSPLAHDAEARRRLWELSGGLTDLESQTAENGQVA